MAADPSAPVSVLGTKWAEQEMWESTWHGFVRTRAKRSPGAPKKFLDWTVDGVPLRHGLVSPNGARCDEVTLMEPGTEGDSLVTMSLGTLLLENEPGVEPAVQFSDGRVGILFCPQCGDLGCGAVSADIRYTEATVEWRDVAYQDGITEEVDASETPAFTIIFDRGRYESTVRGLLGQWGAAAEPGAQDAIASS